MIGGPRLNRAISLFDPSGAEHPQRSVALPGRADRIGVDSACRIWLVTRGPQGYAIWMADGGVLYVARPDETSWTKVADLAAHASASATRAAAPDACTTDSGMSAGPWQ